MAWLKGSLIAIMITLGACAPDPIFMSCPLSQSIEVTCSPAGDSTIFTCVVAEHPYCLESICASWQGADAVCTRACVAHADCPVGASCQTHLGLSFCVQDSDLNENVYDLPEGDPQVE